MGIIAAATPSISNVLIDIQFFEGRLYALARDSGNTNHIIYRLNLSEDDWEIITTFSFYYLDNLLVLGDKLYMFSFQTTVGKVYKLNDDKNGVDLVVDDPNRTYFFDMEYFDDKIYVGLADPNTNDTYLSILNTSLGIWEDVEDTTSIGYVRSLAVHNNQLYAFMWDTSTFDMQLRVLNESGDSLIYISHLNFSVKDGAPKKCISYNGNLYAVSYYSLYRVNDDLNSVTVAFNDYDTWDTNYVFIYRDRLHVINRTLNRLSDEGIGNERILTDTDLTRAAVYNNTMYVINDSASILYKYNPINSVSLAASKVEGMTTVPINFLNMSVVDYPATYYWEFGDGDDSTDENPAHTYSTPNTYDVSLTVTCDGQISSYTAVGLLTIYTYFHKYIYTMSDLQSIGSGPSWPVYGEYELANDIDATGFGGASGFAPISMFRGKLNGAGYTISNFFIDTTSDAAIFYTVEAASFENLNFTDVDITGNSYATLLFIDGTSPIPQNITNCHVTGAIEAYTRTGLCINAQHYIFTNCSSELVIAGYVSYIGGLAGAVNGCDFISCNASFSSTTDYGNMGGIALTAYETSQRYCTVYDCHTNLNCTGYYIGGLFYELQGVVNDSSCIGYIESDQYGGGLVIYMRIRGNCSNLYTHCDVIGDQNQTGGLFGTCYPDQQKYGLYSISDSYTTGNIRSYWRVGGLTGESRGVAYVNCYSTGDVGIHFCGGLVGDIEGNLTNCFTLGNVRGARSVGAFCGQIVANSNVTNCYSLGEVTYGHFAGEYYDSDTVENVGGFVGYGSSNGNHYENCYCYGSVGPHPGTISVPADYIGGFMGINYAGNFYKCYSFGDVEGSMYVGGFMGYHLFNDLTYKIEECFSLGNVVVVDRTRDAYTGGFIGTLRTWDVQGKILNCFARGNVTVYSQGNKRYTGGFVGHFDEESGYEATIENCFSTGIVYDSLG